jgi:hypothetical protein
MFFKESEVQARLSSPNNLAVKMGLIESANSPEIMEASVTEMPPSNIVEHKRSGSGRTAGTVNRTPEERMQIAEDAAILGSAEAARIHGCSQSQAHSYAHGFNTCAQRLPSNANGESAINAIEKVRQRAIDKILMAMDLITDDKLGNQTPQAISQVAANLSKIPSNLESRDTGDINRGNTVNVVVYSPPVKEERQYKTIKIA